MLYCDIIKQQEEVASQVKGNADEVVNIVEQTYIVKV
jgi:hypothetical protein